MSKKIKCDIEHVKIIKPTKSVLRKIHKEVRHEMITEIPMRIQDCYYFEGLRLSKSGRQLIKKYKSEYLVNVNRFHDEGFTFNKAIDKILKEVFLDGVFLIEVIKDKIPHPKVDKTKLDDPCSIYLWDAHKDFKDYSKPLTHYFQMHKTMYVHNDEQLKAIQTKITHDDKHYLKTLKRLPKTHFIVIDYDIQ